LGDAKLVVDVGDRVRNLVVRCTTTKVDPITFAARIIGCIGDMFFEERVLLNPPQDNVDEG